MTKTIDNTNVLIDPSGFLCSELKYDYELVGDHNTMHQKFNNGEHDIIDIDWENGDVIVRANKDGTPTYYEKFKYMIDKYRTRTNDEKRKLMIYLCGEVGKFRHSERMAYYETPRKPQFRQPNLLLQYVDHPDVTKRLGRAYTIQHLPLLICLWREYADAFEFPYQYVTKLLDTIDWQIEKCGDFTTAFRDEILRDSLYYYTYTKEYVSDLECVIQDAVNDLKGMYMDYMSSGIHRISDVADINPEYKVHYVVPTPKYIA